MEDKVYDVIIIGSGPAGLTAAIYTTRAGLKTLVLAGSKWGGQLQLTTLVENFPGFPDGIQGPDLMLAMRKQAEKFGTEILERDFVEADFSPSTSHSTVSPSTVSSGQSNRSDRIGSGQVRLFKIRTSEKEYEGRSVIIATGADTKWLGVTGEEKLIGRGVSSCASCDAPFFREKNVIVVGGGDSAMEEALVLAKFAKSVTLVHRSNSFKASEIMLKRVKESPKIKMLTNTEIKEVVGEMKVEKVRLFNSSTNQETETKIDGVFVAIGHIPNSKQFSGIDVDEKGFIKVSEHTKTNIEGVFVAGDIHDDNYKQAVTAAGYGCAAALEAEKWLDSVSA